MTVLLWLLKATTFWIRVCHKTKGKWYADQAIFSCVKWWNIMAQTTTYPDVMNTVQSQPIADEALIQIIDRIDSRRHA